jgi:hypothetical protein
MNNAHRRLDRRAKNVKGLDRVRRCPAWYRHITLSMLAHALLAVTAHAARPALDPPAPDGDTAAPAGKGTRGLRTDLRAAQDIQCAAGHTG